jgi:hypothetical protein
MNEISKILFSHSGDGYVFKGLGEESIRLFQICKNGAAPAEVPVKPVIYKVFCHLSSGTGSFIVAASYDASAEARPGDEDLLENAWWFFRISADPPACNCLIPWLNRLDLDQLGEEESLFDDPPPGEMLLSREGDKLFYAHAGGIIPGQWDIGQVDLITLRRSRFALEFESRFSSYPLCELKLSPRGDRLYFAVKPETESKRPLRIHSINLIENQGIEGFADLDEPEEMYKAQQKCNDLRTHFTAPVKDATPRLISWELDDQGNALARVEYSGT